MLKKVQAIECQLSDDPELKKHTPVGVVIDNATRWLSQLSMIERALILRPFYNSFVQRALSEWNKHNLTKTGNIRKGSKKLFFLQEENRMTDDNWHMLQALHDILLDFQLVVKALEGDGQGKHQKEVKDNEIESPLSGKCWISHPCCYCHSMTNFFYYIRYVNRRTTEFHHRHENINDSVTQPQTHSIKISHDILIKYIQSITFPQLILCPTTFCFKYSLNTPRHRLNKCIYQSLTLTIPYLL